ncbi:MAG TPA: type II toxin-antitoxin system Phd/YefM family antitoxin [Gaiellaceae bacterium]|nr:type II toxin-antitoxin system Phd/YefM family antitoxin [Gaiellaceae bacterium]
MLLSIGIRELRQNASRYLRLVEERGEPIQITDRGRPVALLTPVPAPASRIEQLRARGRIRPAKGSWRDLGPPVEPEPGAPLPSEVLAQMREHER